MSESCAPSASEGDEHQHSGPDSASNEPESIELVLELPEETSTFVSGFPDPTAVATGQTGQFKKRFERLLKVQAAQRR